MFSPKTVSFLRRLKRNNDREWFREHKTDYERHVREPYVALLARLDEDFRSFAPALVSHPSVSFFRIYRDTRFSANKAPLKTQIGAYFPHKAMRKRGAGLYLEIGPDRVFIGGGLYRPDTADLQAIREHIAAHHTQLRRIVRSGGFRRTIGELDGDRLQRVPRGFPADHPAAEYLRFRQFLAGTNRPAAFAYDPHFYRELLSVFREVAPLVRFLNSAIAPSTNAVPARAARRPARRA